MLIYTDFMETHPFETKVVKIGNSEYVHLPKALREFLGISTGQKVRIKLSIPEDKDAVLGFQTHFSDFDYLNQGVEV